MTHDAWDRCVEQIKALPEDEQIIMSLRFEHGMNAAEIAATLGIDAEEASRRLNVAVDKCRPELE